MDPLWRGALWQQFGATIDMLENALLARTGEQWTGRLWSDHSGDPQSSQYAAFWCITHHTLFWLDFYLTGSLEGFAPPTPFTVEDGAPSRVLPDQPYNPEELHAYLVRLRQQCQTTVRSLTDEQAHNRVYFPWIGQQPISYYELLLYTMRHVQEHAAQLNLFLGHHGVPDEALDWVARARDEAGH